MADAGDLKSPGSNPVWVRPPPPACFLQWVARAQGARAHGGTGGWLEAANGMAARAMDRRFSPGTDPHLRHFFQRVARALQARRPGGIGSWLMAAPGHGGLSHGPPLLAVIDPHLRHHFFRVARALRKRRPGEISGWFEAGTGMATGAIGHSGDTFAKHLPDQTFQTA